MIFNLQWLKSNNRIHSIRWACVLEGFSGAKSTTFLQGWLFVRQQSLGRPSLITLTHFGPVSLLEDLFCRATSTECWQLRKKSVLSKAAFQKDFFLSSPSSTCIVWWSRLNYFVEIPHFGKYTVLLSFFVKQVFTLKVHLCSIRSHRC